MDKFIVIGMHVSNRMINAVQIQQVISEYGCYVKTRIGLHEVAGDFCSPAGLILLELYGDAEKCAELEAKLRAIEGIELQKMEFDK